jgi:glycerol-3-phosphate dehydrogenase (NAD(P)+)
MKKILVIGAGTWGSAIANLVAKNSYRVILSSNQGDIIQEINNRHTNHKYLPNIKLSANIKAVKDFFAEIKDADFAFIVVPSLATTEVFAKISKLTLKKNCKFVICSKGVEPKSLLLLSDAFEKITKIKNYAVLSGPNFAIEVAQEIPTITTIASKDKKLANEVIKILNNDYFKASYFKDPRTAEICGIVKNIIAIGCGIAEGLDLGVNAKSAIVMKGIAEIQLLCNKLKASNDITNAAGFGDIFLTCSSLKSRNNTLGALISKGKTYKEVLKETGKTYEGAASAQAIAAIAKKLKLKLDLCEKINEILTHKHTKTQIKAIITKTILS